MAAEVTNPIELLDQSLQTTLDGWRDFWRDCGLELDSLHSQRPVVALEQIQKHQPDTTIQMFTEPTSARREIWKAQIAIPLPGVRSYEEQQGILEWRLDDTRDSFVAASIVKTNARLKTTNTLQFSGEMPVVLSREITNGATASRADVLLPSELSPNFLLMYASAGYGWLMQAACRVQGDEPGLINQVSISYQDKMSPQGRPLFANGAGIPIEFVATRSNSPYWHLEPNTMLARLQSRAVAEAEPLMPIYAAFANEKDDLVFVRETRPEQALALLIGAEPSQLISGFQPHKLLRS